MAAYFFDGYELLTVNQTPYFLCSSCSICFEHVTAHKISQIVYSAPHNLKKIRLHKGALSNAGTSF